MHYGGYHPLKTLSLLLALCTQGKDIVFRFIIEYSSWRHSGPNVCNKSIFISGFLKDDILTCVETWD